MYQTQQNDKQHKKTKKKFKNTEIWKSCASINRKKKVISYDIHRRKKTVKGECED